MSEECTNNSTTLNILKYDQIRQEDVEEIENPAFVVMEQEGKGGCIVEWNAAFEELTNLVPNDIDNKFCYQIIQGFQQYRNQKNKWCYEPVCGKSCRFRTIDNENREKSPQSLRNVWINSKDRMGRAIKRRVDIIIFPFSSGNKSCALHIIFDKKCRHDASYFHTDIMKKGVDPIDKP